MASVTDFVNSNSHSNPVTGCVIWDGDISRTGKPVFDMGGVKMDVLTLIYASENGAQPTRTKYNTTCENNRCVKAEHIEATVPERKQEEFDGSLVAAVDTAFFTEGKRQDVVATELGISQPTVSKIVAHIRRLKAPA